MPRRDQDRSSGFPRIFPVPPVHPLAARGKHLPSLGTSGYTNDVERTSEELYVELDGGTVLHAKDAWNLSVWSVHQAGTGRWLQVTVSSAEAHHDLVLHMPPDTGSRDVIASIEAWLASPCPSSRIIYM